MTKVVLRPQIDFSGEKLPTPEDLAQLHHEAHEACFIANSVTTEVVVESPRLPPASPLAEPRGSLQPQRRRILQLAFPHDLDPPARSASSACARCASRARLRATLPSQ